MIKLLSDIDKINKILLVGLSPLIPPENLPGSEWADKYYYLSEESSSNAGKWTCYPYQVGLLDFMVDDRIYQVNIMKSRRLGYTEMLKAAYGCTIHMKNRNCMTWLPKDKTAKKFALSHVNALIRDVKVLGNKLMCKPGTRSQYNTLELKAFKGCTWDIQGGTAPDNFRLFTKEFVGYDELDAFLQDIGGEGNCLKLGDGRLDDAAYPKSIRGSTPAEKEFSLIEPAVNSSDVILYRFVKCPDCAGLFRLSFKDFNFHNAEFPCTHCGNHQQYHKYPRMDLHGQWRSENEDIRYDEQQKIFTDAEGGRIRTPGRIGIKIWSAYSYLKSWSFFLREWNEAMEHSKSGDITLLKTAVNTLRGETWETKVESRDHGEIAKLTENYNTSDKIPNEILVITIGADVQGDRIELEILGHGLNGESWSLDYAVLPGDVIEGKVLDTLDQEFLRTFTRVDGVKLKIRAMFLDSGYQTTQIYKYTRIRKKHKVFAVMGTDVGMIPNKPVWKGDKKSKTLLYTSNANEAKRLIFKRLSIVEHGPGKCHFPHEYPETYFKGLTNAVMYKKMTSGVFMGYGWRKKKINQPDEPLDCRHYAIAAFNHLSINMEVLSNELKTRS